MCRFVSYFGAQGVLLKTVLEDPSNSLINQSIDAKEGIHAVNADGFGVAWYNFNVDNNPALFRSIQPAWNDINLSNMINKIESSCFLAHVRAATIGDVGINNCHPFVYKNYAFVHNGTIGNFNLYKKEIANLLDEELYLSIKGNTDSEHLFYLVMHFMKQGKPLKDAVKSATHWISEIQSKSNDYSRLNILIMDGGQIVASRYITDINKDSLAIKYLAPTNDNVAITISSEQLSDNPSWEELPLNHLLSVERNNMSISIEEI